jgi:hypothetical protein
MRLLKSNTLSIFAYVIYLFLLISLSFIILQPHLAVADPVVEVKTLDSEINRLSTEYKLNEVDKKLIVSIINCESTMYGSAVNHNRLKDGTIWSSDFGPFQINDYYHAKTMTTLGLDIYDQFDSLEYGFMLFKSQGTKPWKASMGCWTRTN